MKERDEDGNPKRLFSSCRDCRASRVKVRVREDEQRLDVEPLRRWLAQRLELEGVWDAERGVAVPFHNAPRSIDRIARDWGTSAKRVQDILKGRVETVSDVYADRVFTGAGSPHLLQVLYGEQLAA